MSPYSIFLIAILATIQPNYCVFGYECVCGIENASSRLVGGIEVSHHKYPWSAYIVGKGKNGWKQCGGVIINDRHIMTSAQCVIGRWDIRVSVGHHKVPLLFHYLSWMFPYFDGFRKTNGYIIHPDFNDTFYYNDIALLRLAERLEFSNSIRPICLPHQNVSLDGTLVVTGWGKTETKASTRTLREAFITEYPFDQCNYEWDETLDKNQFCAADIGKDACIGDSGGPVVKIQRGRYYVVGIISFGSSTVCGNERNSVHTRVSSYVSWIKEQTKFSKYCHE